MAYSLQTIERVCKIFHYLATLQKRGGGFVSSRKLAAAVGATNETVRKDFSALHITGFTRRGYNVEILRRAISAVLHLGKERKACIVGLGRLGTALLDYEKFQEDGFDIVAGFDSNINKIERLRTPIDVYPVGELARVIAEKHIELGIIAVPAEAAQLIADQLIGCGVRGILNFSPVRVAVPPTVMYRDMDFTNALRVIAARFTLQKKKEEHDEQSL